MIIHNLDSETDYRLKHLDNLGQTFYSPLSDKSDEFVQNAINELVNDEDSKEKTLLVKGREIRVRFSYSDLAVFDFNQLCASALGAEDYIEIAKSYGTIILKNIPELTSTDYNLAIRFTNLIDALYEHNVKLIATAETAIDDIYSQGDRSFEFARTASRLHEMQSQKYLGKAHISE